MSNEKAKGLGGLLRSASSLFEKKARPEGEAPPEGYIEERFDVVPSDNTEMQEAIAQARETLPIFFKTFVAGLGSADDYGLKVGFDTVPVPELIWVQAIKINRGGGLSGKLANEPRHMGWRRAGSAVDFDESQIVDWSIRVEGRHYGNFTTRVLAKLHPEMVDQLGDYLWETPLPPEFKYDS